MRLEALRQSHLKQLFDRMQSDRDHLGSEYMSMVLREWDWFECDMLDCIQYPSSCTYFVITDDDDVIGLMQLSVCDDHVRPGYWLYEPYRGRGIMTHYLSELLATVSLRVVVTVEPDNHSSMKLMERMGYTRSKTTDSLLYFEAA